MSKPSNKKTIRRRRRAESRRSAEAPRASGYQVPVEVPLDLGPSLAEVEALSDRELARVVRGGANPAWHRIASRAHDNGVDLDERTARAWLRWRLARWRDPDTGEVLAPPVSPPESDEEAAAHLYPALTQVADHVVYVASALAVAQPAVEFRAVATAYEFLTYAGAFRETAALSIDRETTWTGYAEVLRRIQETTEYIDDHLAAGVPALPEALQAARDLRAARELLTMASTEIRDVVTIIGAPLWLYPIPGFDPTRDRDARPPTVAQLRLMTDRGLEAGGHGTITYMELAAHFGWQVPPSSLWPAPDHDAPILHSPIVDAIHEAYERELAIMGTGPGPIPWLHALLVEACHSCGASPGAQCTTRSTGWRLPAHRSHRARAAAVRRSYRATPHPQ